MNKAETVGDGYMINDITRRFDLRPSKGKLQTWVHLFLLLLIINCKNIEEYKIEESYKSVEVAGNYLKINSFISPEISHYYSNDELHFDTKYIVRVMINANIDEQVSILDHEIYSFYTNNIDKYMANIILYKELKNAEIKLKQIINANKSQTLSEIFLQE